MVKQEEYNLSVCQNRTSYEKVVPVLFRNLLAVEPVEIVGQLFPLFERGRRKTIEFKQTGRMRGLSKGRCLPWALTHRPLSRGGAIERARERCER